MAYNYLDEDVIQSDANWHSFGLKTWLQNIDQIGDERWCKGAAVWPTDFTPVWASPFPVAWGPYYLYVPDGETREIDVTVYHNGITYSPGGNAFRMAATTKDEYPAAEYWSNYPVAGAAAALTPMTIRIHRPGWQRVWIWFQSYVKATALESDLTSAYQNQGL